MMGDFEKGCFFMACAVMLFLVGTLIGYIISNKAIGLQCVTYNMATIDNKIYDCMPKGDK